MDQKHCSKSGKIAGFSLLAMSLLILVLGFFSVVAANLYKVYKEQNTAALTSKNMELVQQALKNYVEVNGHLPCPASMEDPIDTREFGQPVSLACPSGNIPGTDYDPAGVRIGAVPVRVLNLPDSAIVDGWKNRMVYAVTVSFARAGADMDSPDGKITINDETSSSVTRTPGNVIYALISPGSDRRGAYGLNGVERVPCDTATISGENCNGDAVFASTINKNYSETASTFTARVAYMANTASFDWVTEPWGACNAACESTGTQARNVFCRRNPDVTVADSYCLSLGPKPGASQSCTNTTACPPGDPELMACNRYYIQVPGPHGGSLNYAFGQEIVGGGTDCPTGRTCGTVNRMQRTMPEGNLTVGEPVFIVFMPSGWTPPYNSSGDPCSESLNESGG